MTKETRAEHKNTNKQEKRTRAEHKNKNKQEKKTRAAKKEEKEYVRRLVPIWLKVLITIVLSLLALIIGLIVGFSILGDGNPLDVLKWETWKHIIDFVTAD